MSRLFDDAQTEYLQRNQAVLSGAPLAMVCWFNSDAGVHQTLMGISDKDEEDHFFILHLTDGDKLWAYVYAGVGNEGTAIATSDWSVDTWHHVCALFVGHNDRRVFLDGGSKGTNAGGATPANLDCTFIGRRTKATPTYYMSGMVAETAIWDLSSWPGATASDKADNFEAILGALAGGASPQTYPLGLVAHWYSIDDDEDHVGSFDMTPYNGPSWGGSHPVITLPVFPDTFEMEATLHAPIVSANVTVTPAAFQILATLYAPIVSADVTVTSAALALALTQHAPGLAFDYVVTPDALALALTLHDPTVIFPVDVTVLAPALQLTVSLLIPEVTVRYIEIPDFMQKDLIDPESGGAWLWLCEIAVPGYETKSIARNTVDVRHAGKDYDRWNLDVGKQTFAGDGSIPRVTLRVGQDPDRAIEDIVNASKGARDGTVKLIRVNEKFLDYEVDALEFNYGVLVGDSDCEWVYFTLGIPNPLTQKIPLRIGSSKICPWAKPEFFKGPECQYVGPETSCKGTIEDCRDNKDNAEHWGAELGLDPNVTRV